MKTVTTSKGTSARLHSALLRLSIAPKPGATPLERAAPARASAQSLSRPRRRRTPQGSPAKKRRAATRGESDTGANTWVLMLPAEANTQRKATAFLNRTQIQLDPKIEQRLRAIIEDILASTRHGQSQAAALTTNGKLTERQIQIAEMVREGHSNKIIANALGLSTGTVKVHLHRIFLVLGVKSRVQLAIELDR
jgi:DNA-binding CsgD family transcriptional regulator